MRSFDQHVMENLWEGSTVVASGKAVFEPEHDRSYQSVFERADAAMYQRKRALKTYLGREQRNDWCFSEIYVTFRACMLQSCPSQRGAPAWIATASRQLSSSS